jgi:hypothetical protein
MVVGDVVKYVINFLTVISITEEIDLVVAKPLELTVDAGIQDVTMHTRFKFPLDYISELEVESENDLIDLTMRRYRVCHITGQDVLLQDVENFYYLKAKMFQLVG